MRLDLFIKKINISLHENESKKYIILMEIELKHSKIQNYILREIIIKNKFTNESEVLKFLHVDHFWVFLLMYHTKKKKFKIYYFI